MKVYVLGYWYYDDLEILGAYSSLEKAEYWYQVLKDNDWKGLHIDTVVLDEQPDMNYTVRSKPREPQPGTHAYQLEQVYEFLKQNVPEYDHKVLAETARLMFPEK